MKRRSLNTPWTVAQLLLLPTVLFLILFLAWPLAQMSILAFEDADGAFSLGNFAEAAGSPTFLRVSATTINMSLWTALLCVLISYPIALYLSRVAGRQFAFLVVLVLIPFWVSVLIRTLSWFVMLGRAGVINSTLIELGLTAEALELLYTRGAVLMSMVHAIAPISILTLLAAMQNVDRRLGVAASTLGASPAAQFWQVYFPLTWRGVTSSFVLCFVLGLGFFVQPTILGSPRETMIGQLIIQQIDELFNWNLAAAIAIVFLSLIALVILLASKLLGISVAPETGAGPAQSARSAILLRRRLGLRVLELVARLTGWAFRRDASAEGAGRGNRAFAYLGLFWLSAPILFLFPVSFTSSQFLSWPPEGFSLDWYAAYFSSDIWVDATVRSVVVGVVTAAVSILFGVPAAIALARGPVSARSLIVGLILLSLAVPNILIALAMFYFFAEIGLVGTNTGLVLGQTVFALPYVVIAMIAAFNNYDWGLNAAAHSLGANPLRAYLHVTFPLVRIGTMSAFVFAFIRSFDELTVAMFIASGTTTTLPKRIWSEAHFNISPTLAAVSTVVVVGVVAVVVITEFLSRKARTKPAGGT